MGKCLAAAILAVMVAGIAEGQTSVPPQEKRPRPIRIVIGGGGWCGGGGGYGYGPVYGGFPGGYRPVPPPPPGCWSGLGYGYSIGSSFGGFTYYYGPVAAPYGGGYGWGYPAAPAPPPAASEPGRAKMSPVLASEKAVEEGRRRLKEGNYRGAVESFREAVTTDLSNTAPQAWFALSLAVTGDYRNADKALRSAAEGAPIEKIDFRSLFRDGREYERIRTVLAAGPGEGSLAVAWILALDGDPARLKRMAEKDAVARKLLP